MEQQPDRIAVRRHRRHAVSFVDRMERHRLLRGNPSRSRR